MQASKQLDLYCHKCIAVAVENSYHDLVDDVLCCAVAVLSTILFPINS